MSGGSSGGPDQFGKGTSPQTRKLPVWLGALLLIGLLCLGGYLAAQGLRPGLPPIMSLVVFLSPMVFAPMVVAAMLGHNPQRVLYWTGAAVAAVALFLKACSTQ